MYILILQAVRFDQFLQILGNVRQDAARLARQTLVLTAFKVQVQVHEKPLLSLTLWWR